MNHWLANANLLFISYINIMNELIKATATIVIAGVTGLAATSAALAAKYPDPICDTIGNYTMCVSPHDSLEGYVVFTAHDRNSTDYYVQITDCKRGRLMQSGTMKGIDQTAAIAIARKSCSKYNF